MTRKIGLDLVRAVAICLVLVAHFIKAFDFVGIYGVELFFALSGFLIGGILHRRLMACDRWSFSEVKTFWLRRWWRTLPNYYLFLALSIPFHYRFGGLLGFKDTLPYLVFSQNLFQLHSLFYGVSWSLCVEEWFYFTFPLALLLFTSMGASKPAALIATTLLFLAVPPVLREHSFLNMDSATVRLLTIPRLDAIFYGVAMAFAVARCAALASFRFHFLAVASLGLIGLFVFHLHGLRTETLVPFYRVAFVGLPICFSLMLPFFAAIETFAAPVTFLSRPVTDLSLWSYSIYLSHIPILTTVYSLFGEGRSHWAVNVFSKIVGLVVCIGVSKIIYEFFESKLMRLRPSENHFA